MQLTQLNIDTDLFLNKLKQDLEVGVEINSSNMDRTKLVKVWTDSEGWEFLVVGLLKSKEVSSVFAVEVQAQGVSKNFLKLNIDLQEYSSPIMNFEKLAQSFAQVEQVTVEEAEDFVGAYLNSTFNRTKTAELFNELAHDKNYFTWLVY